jgi:hypothetical protein
MAPTVYINQLELLRYHLDAFMKCEGCPFLHPFVTYAISKFPGDGPMIAVSFNIIAEAHYCTIPF